MKIYFDLDGVIVDFENGVLELCGFEPISQDKRTKEETDSMWDTLRDIPHFYLKLKMMPGADELFHKAQQIFGEENCEILTAVPRPERNMVTARDDKIQWVREHLGENVKVHTVLRREKIEFAKGRNCVLIDDLEKTVIKWEIAGGIGIWHRSNEETLSILTSLKAGDIEACIEANRKNIYMCNSSE